MPRNLLGQICPKTNFSTLGILRWILDKILSFHAHFSNGSHLSSSQEPLKGATSKIPPPSIFAKIKTVV